MGKKRHSQDKMWITYKELVSDWGGKSDQSSKGPQIKKLPFYCCSLSFMPFKDPYCLPDGTIFDIINILPYIRKFKKNPITGLPMKANELIKLNFTKNQEGDYHCPITYKVFTENSTIIAIKETGNVYSFEAYDELNKKVKNFKDLLTNEPFDPKNVIIIQEPIRNDKLIKDFYFIKNKEDLDFIKHGDNFYEKKENFVNLPTSYTQLLDNYEETSGKEHSKRIEVLNLVNNKEVSLKEDDPIMKRINAEIEEYETNILNLEKNIDNIQSVQNFKKMFRISPLGYLYLQKKEGNKKHSQHTEGKVAGSFTSTYVDSNYDNKLRNLSDNEIRNDYYNIIKSKQLKGFVRLNTNFGELNIMLYCDLAPKTCENFIELCESNYYDGTVFHRLIKNFVLQGGDPTATGTGGVSSFGKTFEDEFNPKINHSKRGILSMANSGKNTNGSQFFILFRSVPHLDNKHSVFGEVVGNIKLLDQLEDIGSNADEHPKKTIKILSTNVFTNPYRDVISEILLKKFSDNYTGKTEKYDVEYLMPKEVNNKEDQIGKYLGRKRESTKIKNIINNDPYVFEKPKNFKKLNSFDFDNW